jgi:hypothetical protein
LLSTCSKVLSRILTSITTSKSPNINMHCNFVACSQHALLEMVKTLGWTHNLGTTTKDIHHAFHPTMEHS